MSQLQTTFDPSLPASRLQAGTSRWNETCRQFLAAIAPHQHPAAAQLLQSLHNGGSGLRDWVSAITWRGAMLPASIPEEIIDVYLADPEAAPLHDCEGCGMAIPVRPSRCHGLDAEPEELYFSKCPACGARTGWYLYFSRQAESQPAGSGPRKPR